MCVCVVLQACEDLDWPSSSLGEAVSAIFVLTTMSRRDRAFARRFTPSRIRVWNYIVVLLSREMVAIRIVEDSGTVRTYICIHTGN